MHYLIDSYAPYFVNGGVIGKLAEGINWLFVDVPFFILRVFGIGVLLIQELLNQSDLFMAKQQDAYTLSLEILKNLGGKGIAQGSILALLILLSAYYLLYHFFFSKKNFSQVLLHYFLIFGLFVFWFGSIATPNGKKSGGTFLIESTSNIVTSLRNSFTSASSDFSAAGSEQTLDETPLFQATIKQTFYYVNTGSLDGIMENGEKIDEKKLLMPNQLSIAEQKVFEKERNTYLENIKDDNPYVRATLDKTMEKSMSVFIGGVNLAVTSYPALYVNGLLSVVQLVIIMLIIAAPVFFVMSFVPACQTILFKFFKILMGILFFPVVLGVFLAVFFWINKVIDMVYLNAMKLVAQPLLVIMSAGIFTFTSSVALIVIKGLLYRSVWKNKYRLLHYFTNQQVAEPEILEKINEKVTEKKEHAKEVMTGGVEMIAGAYTGNQMLITDGMSKAMPMMDKALHLGKHHFKEDEDMYDRRQEDSKDWRHEQDEDEAENLTNDLHSMAFMETDIDALMDSEPQMLVEEIDYGLGHEEMPMMLNELPEDLLKAGDAVSINNLEEMMFQSEENEADRLMLEQVEKETFLVREEYELDNAFPEDTFFGNEIENEINGEGW